MLWEIPMLLSKISSILVCLFVIMLPFQDSFFQELGFGYLGQNVSNIILIIYILFLGIRLFQNKVTKKRFYIVCGVPFLAFFYSVIMILPLYESSEFYLFFYRCITGSLALFMYFIEYYMIKENMGLISEMLPIAWGVNFLGWMLCDELKIGFNPLIHVLASENYPRFCGFASEASIFCLTTFVLTMLCVHYTSSKIKKILMLSFCGYVLLLGGSKGTLISSLIASVFYVLISHRISSVRKIVFILLMGGISYYAFEMILSVAFTVDLESATSFATRGTVTILAVVIAYHFPFGVGYGRFIPEFINYIPSVFDYLQESIPLFILKYDEIADILGRGGGKGIGVFNSFFQYLAYFGIPFLFIFMYYIKKYYVNVKNTKYMFLSINIIFIFFSVLTFHTLNCVSIAAISIFEYELNKELMKS